MDNGFFSELGKLLESFSRVWLCRLSVGSWGMLATPDPHPFPEDLRPVKTTTPGNEVLHRGGRPLALLVTSLGDRRVRASHQPPPSAPRDYDVRDQSCLRSGRHCARSGYFRTRLFLWTPSSDSTLPPSQLDISMMSSLTHQELPLGSPLFNGT